MASKKVKITLPLTRAEKDDVYVAVNGKSLLIKRGEPVEVPEEYVEVLKNRESMLSQSFAFEAQAAEKGEGK